MISSEPASRRLKIAYAIPGTGVSGGIAVICQHANRLRARGHDVVLASETPDRSIDWFPGLRVPVVGLEDVSPTTDILVATGWTTVFQVARMPARHRFYFVQSDESRFHPEGSAWQHITRLSYTMGMNYLTEARWIRSWLQDVYGQTAEVVPNGLDEAIFHPDRPLAPRGERPRVLLEGAIGLPYKGMEDAFQAVAAEDVEIWCVSSFGKPKRGWRCDRFFQEVPMQQMRHIYSSCDVLLKLSRVEGFFGPPMEMMACGGAVVVARVTGHDEYIQDGVNALVVAPGDVAGATAAVRRVLGDADLRASLVQEGLRTARAWPWEPSVDTLERYFLDVRSGTRGVASGREIGQRSFAVAYFYGLLRGEVYQEPSASFIDDPPTDASPSTDSIRAAALFSSGAVASMQSDPTEKLIARLRYEPWFRWLARALHWAYRHRPRVRALGVVGLRGSADDRTQTVATSAGPGEFDRNRSDGNG